MSGWIGVDLDGTLAHYEAWKGQMNIGAPIPAMVARVKRWIAAGHEVRIFTARVASTQVHNLDGTPHDSAGVVAAIQAWCLEHLGVALAVTCVKDWGMIELWDDRAVQVRMNTGEPVGQSTRGL
jgi:hypothetical protein